ncbi:phosphonopyruvate decarboxylase [Salinisphaera sp. Q1T1-3]|uniref:phosphonopyruvate decarboxylase n=1 Tax=Salinisphaera sp. Q1T1-3 TaxID=2321229 RepID=UPI000E752310|nr:phosphonopyruvate decarboxylase [Salinisphaera sp. Q1T1-3]RJS93960.1 phosphonopyruvate decarboxylase [Salinisphaera sp. Q1T1-3]
MIEADDFIDRAAAYGYDYYAGVPCSFLTPFINTVIDAERLTYVSAANEGDAVALAAGRALAGGRAVAMMQNSGLGNAVSPLTSLNWVFELPILLIVTWRGAPDVSDEPQHALMGRITTDMLETMDVPWEFFPDEAEAIDAALARAEAHMNETGRPYCLLMKKNTVAPAELRESASPSQSRGAITYRPAPRRPVDAPGISRRDALRDLVASTDPDNSVIIASTGYAGRELFAVADRPNHLYMVGSMGCAPLLGLGLASARPDLKVIVVDGDGAALMRLGGMATLAAYGPTNLAHLLLDNGMHESTGGQATVSAGLSFGAIAAACGYRTVHEGHERSLIDQLLTGSTQGPAFAHLHIEPGVDKANLPRPNVSPIDVRTRLMAHIGAGGS